MSLLSTKPKDPTLPPAALGIKQTIQARHGTATYVPKGHTIKVINTYGRQVVGLWGFALHSAPTKRELAEDDRQEREIARAEADGDEHSEMLKKILAGETNKGVEAQKKDQNDDEGKDEKLETSAEESADSTGVSEQSEPTEDSASTELVEREDISDDLQSITPDKPQSKGWSSYIPTLPLGKNTAKERPNADDEVEKSMASSKSWGSYIPSLRRKQPESGVVDDQDSERSWASFIPSGQGFSSYIPTTAISSIAAMHKRDPSKSVAEQLYDFSKTPVGVAGISVASGSGYASSIYAAYSAYSSVSGAGSTSSLNAHGMEFLSMPHTRSSTQHLSPRIGDELVTNLRAPLLTLLEDTSAGVHDTLMAACDPHGYQELGVEHWEEHRSCAENLVLALQELNMQIGLKGNRAIGADVTVNNVPAPLNLFMNIPWSQDGSLSLEVPKGKRGNYVKLRAERDVVIVMSACPQEMTEVNAKKPMVAHFVVEEDEAEVTEKESAAQPVVEKTQERVGAQPLKTTKQESQSQSGTPLVSRKSAPKLQIRSSSQRQLGPQAKLSSESQQRQTSTFGLKETQGVERLPMKRQPTPKDGRPKPKKLEKVTKPKKLERRGTTS